MRAGRPQPRGDEAELYRSLSGPLEQAVRRRVRGSAAAVEDACAFAWEQLLCRQPERSDRLLGWLVTVATREGWRLVRIDRRSSPLPRPGGGEGDGGLSEHLVAFELLEGLAALAPVQRRLLVRCAAGYSYRELAQLERRQTNYVNKHLVRARRALRERDASFVPASAA